MKFLKELLEAVIDASSRFGNHNQSIDRDPPFADPHEVFINQSLMHHVQKAKQDYEQFIKPLMTKISEFKTFGNADLPFLYFKYKKANKTFSDMDQQDQRQLQVLARNLHFFELYGHLYSVFKKLDQKHNGIISNAFGQQGLFRALQIYRMLLKVKNQS